KVSTRKNTSETNRYKRIGGTYRTLRPTMYSLDRNAGRNISGTSVRRTRESQLLNSSSTSLRSENTLRINERSCWPQTWQYSPCSDAPQLSQMPGVGSGHLDMGRV